MLLSFSAPSSLWKPVSLRSCPHQQETNVLLGCTDTQFSPNTLALEAVWLLLSAHAAAQSEFTALTFRILIWSDSWFREQKGKNAYGQSKQLLADDSASLKVDGLTQTQRAWSFFEGTIVSIVWVYDWIDETVLQLPFNLQPFKHIQLQVPFCRSPRWRHFRQSVNYNQLEHRTDSSGWLVIADIFLAVSDIQLRALLSCFLLSVWDYYDLISISPLYQSAAHCI